MIDAALIDELIGHKATFAAFRQPGSSPEVYLQTDPTLLPPRPDQRCFVLAPFEHTVDAVRCIRPDIVLNVEPYASNWASHVPNGERPMERPMPGHDRAGFGRAVLAALKMIDAGRLEKVVLARSINADLDDLSLGQLFMLTQAELPNAFVALCSTDQYGIWIGASPEYLLRRQGDQIEVDALAGTLPAEEAPPNAADWGSKEREEQAMVTRSVTDILSRHGVRSLRAEGPKVRVAGNVAHLHTLLNGSAGHIDTLALAQALHPTPAVGGTPKDEALASIRSLEPRPRSLYAGFWGPMKEGLAHLFVNIRCMEVVDHHALIHVGAGITAASSVRKECDEVEHKGEIWKHMIALLRQAR